MPDYVLGLDIGTQAVKGIVVGADGNIVANASLERSPTHPFPGWVEMDAERDLWRSGSFIIRELLSNSKLMPEDIIAVGVSGLVPCLCALDHLGIPLRPVILYSDNRALSELEWVNRTGELSLSAEAVAPKLIWIKNNEPHIFKEIDIVLSAHNYFVYRLTGQYTMDPDTAAIMGGIFNEKELGWSIQKISQLNLPASIWAPVIKATDIAGKVSDVAARATGLLAGTPVITGSGDTFPTIIGCGAVEPGDAMISFGTTGLLTITNQPLVDSAAGPHFSTYDGKTPVTWGANVLSAGRLVRWYRDNFCQTENIVTECPGNNEFSLLEAEANRVPAGSDGLIVLPHLLGRRTPFPDANLKGAILGLTPSHTGGHIYRAILESFAYNIRQGFEMHSSKIRRLIATAGGAKSKLWRQIVAETLNINLEYHPRASGALGIAFLAAYSTGMVNDFSIIKNEWLKDVQSIIPDAHSVERYQDYYSLYCEFDDALAVPFERLAGLM